MNLNVMPYGGLWTFRRIKMNKKNAVLVFWGALGLIILGLVIPQPIQALLVLVESPIKDWLFSHGSF